MMIYYRADAYIIDAITGIFSFSLLYKTNRVYVVEHPFIHKSQNMSKCGENKRVPLGLQEGGGKTFLYNS